MQMSPKIQQIHYELFFSVLLIITTFPVTLFGYKNCNVAEDIKSKTETCESFTIENLGHETQSIMCFTDQFPVVIDEINVRKVVTNNYRKLKIIYCPLSYKERTFLQSLQNTDLNRIDSLTFKHNIIANSTLKSDYFTDLSNMNELNFAFNSLEYIENNTFHLLANLKMLDLSYNSLRNSLTKHIFTNLTNLETLRLNFNLISTLNGDIFEYLDNLKYIDLTGNLLQTLGDNLFKNNLKLEILKIGSNRIRTIPEKLLTDLNRLKLFHFDNNDVFQLNRFADKNVSYDSFVTFVSQNNQHLSNISEHYFQLTPNVEQIVMSNCAIIRLPSKLFRKLKSLEILLIGFNQIVNLTREVFQGLRKLRILNLEGNQLSQIEDSSQFDDLINLRELSLSDNNFNELPAMIFSKLANLERLNLARNRLNVIPISIESLENLQYFDIHRNLIKEYDSLGSGRIEFIDLSFNRIQRVDENFLLKSIHLKYLNLSFNLIESVFEENFQIVSIENVNINLSSNFISRFRLNRHRFSFKQIDNRFTYVYLQNNSFICDCSIYDLLNYDQLHNYNKLSLKIVTNQLTCFNRKTNQSNFLKSIKINDFACPIQKDSSLCSEVCTKCDYVPFQKKLIVDCANRNLKIWPKHLLDLLFDDIKFNREIDRIQLDFSSNSLTDFDINYDKIETVNLSYNLINHVYQLPLTLKSIDLSFNNLSIVQHDVLRNYSLLKSVYFNGNPWVCDCRNLGLVQFMKSPSLNIDCGFTLQMDPNYCKFRPFIFYMFLIVVFSLTLSILNAFYWYRKQIRIWLFMHNLWFWFDTCEADDGKKYDAFCSYAHEDDEFVAEQLKPFLEDKNGYKICFYGRDWLPGFTIPDLILNSVENSRRTIIVLSKSFLKSIWANEEFHVAYNHSKKDRIPKLIVIVRDNIDIDSDIDDDTIKSYLRNNIYLKWGDTWFWHKLKFAMPHYRGKKTPTKVVH